MFRKFFAVPVVLLIVLVFLFALSGCSREEENLEMNSENRYTLETKKRKYYFYIGVCRGLRAAPNTFSQKGS